MRLVLALGEFFNAAQTERLADAVVLALVTLLSLVPVWVAVLQLKLAREIRQIRQNQEFYREKIDTISGRGHGSGAEGEPVAPSEVRELREEGVVGRDGETRDLSQRRRDASLSMVQSEEVDRDQSSAN